MKCKLFLKGLTIDKCEDFEVLYVIDEIIDIILCSSQTCVTGQVCDQNIYDDLVFQINK